MKFHLTLLFILFNSFVCLCQKPNIVGLFREIDIYDRSATFVEFKDDSTVILKKTRLNDSSTTKEAVVANGRWKFAKDTVVLYFDKDLDGSYLQNGEGSRLEFLVKNDNALYTRRLKNGKFSKDGILRKAYKLTRLPKELLYEYNTLPD